MQMILSCDFLADQPAFVKLMNFQKMLALTNWLVLIGHHLWHKNIICLYSHTINVHEVLHNITTTVNRPSWSTIFLKKTYIYSYSAALSPTPSRMVLNCIVDIET